MLLAIGIGAGTRGASEPARAAFKPPAARSKSTWENTAGILENIIKTNAAARTIF